MLLDDQQVVKNHTQQEPAIRQSTHQLSEHSSRTDWDPDFFSRSTLFDPVADLARLFHEHQHNWPGLKDYQTLFNASHGELRTAAGKVLRFVRQGTRPLGFAQQYEPRIFLTGEIQTRTENWHDFFQVLVWSLFAQTKLRLNELHFDAANQRYRSVPRQPNRNAVENAVTLFDECGAVIVSSRPDLLDLIRQFSWKQLFWQQRNAISRHMRCYLFGHALYEKALHPYTGLTAHALLLPVQTSFYDMPAYEQNRLIDKRLAQFFSRPTGKITTRMFQPFPVLGMPGACDDNCREDYYDNTAYFRPGRRACPSAP